MMGSFDSWRWLHQRLYDMPGDREAVVGRVEALDGIRTAGRDWDAL